MTLKDRVKIFLDKFSIIIKYLNSKIKSYKELLLLDLILIILTYFALKIIQSSNIKTQYHLSNGSFNIFFFVLFIFFVFIGMFFTLNKWIMLIKNKKITNVRIIFSHFILILFFTILIFSIIFGNPHDGNKIIHDITGETTMGMSIDIFYFTASTMIGSGYGDYVPIGSEFKFFSIILMIFGWVIFSTLLSSMISYVLNK